SDVVLDDTSGRFHVAGTPARALGWSDLADSLPGQVHDGAAHPGGSLAAETDYAPVMPTFPFGAHVAVVEVDIETGRVRLCRLVAVDDAGTLINPLLVHGQVIGGAVQALGECLTEEAIHDAEGQMRSGSFLDYCLLTAAEIPPIVTGEVQTPSPLNPLGAKGAGEGGAVGTLAAVANAVTDALGGRHVDPPFTSETLWRVLHAPPEAGDS
ncbi:MAG: molybdopterin cofactor-binding domain-containing protein, partial [Solirubrobacteraceae bacterium]